jgi:perosamine synthetase
MQSTRLRRMFDQLAADRARPSDRAELGVHHRRIRAAVARLAVVEHRAVPLTVASHTVRTSGGLTLERYELRGTSRDTLRVSVLSSPQAQRSHAAVLVCPGRHAVMEQVTGEVPPDHPDRNVAEHLARAGLRTVTIDYGLTGSLDTDRLGGREETAVLGQALALGGQPLLGALMEDALAVLGWLRARADVDPLQVGLFGHSMGGAVALHTALVCGDELPVCVASHMGTYPALYGELLTGNGAAVLPGILRHADLPDLFGALAPAPLQVQYGRVDPGLAPEDAATAAEQIRKSYALAEAEQNLAILDLPMGHGTSVVNAIKFFQHNLHEARPEPPIHALRVDFDVAARLEIADRVDDALASGVLTLGPQLAQFEASAQEWVGGPAVGVSSGSAALEIVFRILGVAGKAVLVPVNTFFATAASAVRAGARVELVDMELDGLGMDPAAMRRALDRHDDVAAVVAVHIGGLISPAIHQTLDECSQRGIPVIEDAAHAFGSQLDGAWAGSLGRYGAYSFYPTKVVTSAEGGVVTAGSMADLEPVLRLRDHGKVAFETNLHDCEGSNWRMSEVHAAVGLVHLSRFGDMVDRRRRIAALYNSQLSDVPGLRGHVVPGGVIPNWYKYVAYLPEGVDRRAFKTRLRARHGVALAGEVYETLLCEQPFFASSFAGRTFERAQWFAARHICLPLYPTMTERHVERVIAALRCELS